MAPDEVLKSLGAGLASIKVTKAERERESAPRFSVFEAMLPNETGLSRVLKFLLDHEAAHGQGQTFLHQFLDLIGCPDCKSRFRVVTEYFTKNGRKIDILLRSDDYIIGIENKPWAGEQPAQCQDYAEDLEWQMPGRWTLVFLTRDGRRPETGGKFTSLITPLKYRDLAEAFSTSCARIQPFLDDFRRYVLEHICWEAEEPNMSEEIELFLRPENLGVTLEILAAGSAIRTRLLEGFRQSMLNHLPGGWCAETIGFEQTDWYLRFFKQQWKDRFGIGFGNVSPARPDVFFGISYVEDRGSKGPIASGKLKEALDEAFGIRGETASCWDWWLPLRKLGKADYQKNWYEIEILKHMAQGEMVEDLYPLVQKAIQAGERYIDREV